MFFSLSVRSMVPLLSILDGMESVNSRPLVAVEGVVKGSPRHTQFYAELICKNVIEPWMNCQTPV